MFLIEILMHFSPAPVNFVDLWLDRMVQYDDAIKDTNQCYSNRHPSPLMVCTMIRKLLFSYVCSPRDWNALTRYIQVSFVEFRVLIRRRSTFEPSMFSAKSLKLIVIVNTTLFTKLPLPGDSKGTVRSSSQTVTCPPLYHTRWRLHTVPF